MCVSIYVPEVGRGGINPRHHRSTELHHLRVVGRRRATCIYVCMESLLSRVIYRDVARDDVSEYMYALLLCVDEMYTGF